MRPRRACSGRMSDAADHIRPLRPRRRWSVPLLLLAPTLLVMAYAFVAPLLTFFEYSFYRFRRGRLEQVFTLDTYSRFLFDEYYHIIIYDTLRMATLVTVLSLLIGYPLAYALYRINRPSIQRWLGLLIFSPILVSVVVRSYGWIVLLSDQGPVNWLLLRLGIVAEPLTLVFNLLGRGHQPDPRVSAVRGISDLRVADAARPGAEGRPPRISAPGGGPRSGGSRSRSACRAWSPGRRSASRSRSAPS
jgi:hypothetical protein